MLLAEFLAISRKYRYNSLEINKILCSCTYYLCMLTLWHRSSQAILSQFPFTIITTEYLDLCKEEPANFLRPRRDDGYRARREGDVRVLTVPPTLLSRHRSRPCSHSH